MEDTNLENTTNQPGETVIASGTGFPEFGDFVSVEGILNNENFQELLGPPEETSGRSESLTLYKSEPDPEPQENSALEAEEEDETSTLTPPENIEEIDSVPEAVDDEEMNPDTPSPSTTPLHKYISESTSIRKYRSRRPNNVSEALISVPRLLGASEQHKIESTKAKDMSFFIRQNMDEYLVRRGFRQPNDPARTSMAFPLQEKVRMNAISYGPQYEAQEITGEIDKFWKFYTGLKTENIRMSEQLKPILVPMLIHFYDECFLSGETAIALRLYTDFGNIFLREDNTKENYNTLFTISKVSTIDEFEGNELIQYLRRKDYVFVLSNITFERLKIFLRSTGCPALLNLFANRMIVQVEESEVKPNYEELQNSERLDESPPDITKSGPECQKNSVILNIPTISLFTTSGSPISGAVSTHGSMLAFGMANSEIRVCFASKRHVNEANMERRRARRKRRINENNTEDDSDEEEEEEEDEEEEDEISAINTMKGHSENVCGLAFHPKTRILFSVSEDTKMKAWDLQDFQCKADYRGHTAPIWCVDQTASGHMLVTGSMDCTARIWVPERSEYLRLLVGHYFDVDCAQFHPNEAYVATGSVDKSVRLWSVSDGNIVRVFTGMNSSVSSIKFHESGRYIIGASDDPFINIWDIAESELVAQIPSPPFCRDITLSGNMLAGCFANSSVHIWNIYPIVGGNNAYEEEENQPFQIKTPKIQEVAENSKSLFKVFYPSPTNLYCLGETAPAPEIMRQLRKTFAKNPLTDGILSKPNQCPWEDSESDHDGSGSEMNVLSAASQGYEDSNYDEASSVESFVKDHDNSQYY